MDWVEVLLALAELSISLLCEVKSLEASGFWISTAFYGACSECWSLEPGLLLCLPWLCVTSHAGAGVQLCESDGGVQQQKSQRVSHQVCCARLK